MQIHSRDEQLLSTVFSFLYLHHMCQRGCYTLPRAPTEETDTSCIPLQDIAMATAAQPPTPVQFQFEPLLPNCQALGFILDAFPEGSESTVLC